MKKKIANILRRSNRNPVKQMTTRELSGLIHLKKQNVSTESIQRQLGRPCAQTRLSPKNDPPRCLPRWDWWGWTAEAGGIPGVKCVLPEPWAFSKPLWEDDWLGEKGLRERRSCGRVAGGSSVRPTLPRSRAARLDSCYFSGRRPWAMWSWPNSRGSGWEMHVYRVKETDAQISRIIKSVRQRRKEKKRTLNPPKKRRGMCESRIRCECLSRSASSPASLSVWLRVRARTRFTWVVGRRDHSASSRAASELVRGWQPLHSSQSKRRSRVDRGGGHLRGMWRFLLTRVSVSDSAFNLEFLICVRA